MSVQARSCQCSLDSLVLSGILLTQAMLGQFFQQLATYWNFGVSWIIHIDELTEKWKRGPHLTPPTFSLTSQEAQKSIGMKNIGVGNISNDHPLIF